VGYLRDGEGERVLCRAGVRDRAFRLLPALGDRDLAFLLAIAGLRDLERDRERLYLALLSRSWSLSRGL
jgi:hypothetical protein